MSADTSTGAFSRFIRGCFLVLLAAIALSLAVDIMRAIWVPLAIIVGVVAAVFIAAVLFNRWRKNRW
ncbi:hypothetical protein R3Q15_02305 [Gordonia amicalis]|uniref:Uncharacterized protein n=1 Tax=Gordonia amicalis TaxID=89053 RepID=A0AAE4U9F7_9ACTN|nr:hypothetical protein [Gordonia amicalis]MDV6310742.1 hypothetical protein [Gordonia amicalis]